MGSHEQGRAKGTTDGHGCDFLEKLLDGAEVEWLPLGEPGELVRGNGLPKADFTESGVPAIHYGQIYTYYSLSTTETISFVSPIIAEKLKKVNTGDVVITNTSENLEDVGKALAPNEGVRTLCGRRQGSSGGVKGMASGSFLRTWV
ncbi:MAG: hypothetical protein ACI9NQ_001631 [Paracoccaceae bacterium]